MKLPAVLPLLVCLACNSSREADAAGEISPGGDELSRAIAQSDVARDAQRLIDQGHSWRATQLLAPVLRDRRKRTPTVLTVAARAAAGWGGWAEVDKLLAKEPWIDSQFAGEARELLTRSALERGADTAALTHASAAAREARSPAVRATRLVLLARALERNNLFDSAVVTYRRAGDALPIVRDWLALRAAGTQRDSTARARIYASVALHVARSRVAWTEAEIRERLGDALGAAERYASLGAPVIALRLRLSVAPDTATRDVVKKDLLEFIGSHGGSDARSAVEVLDKGFTRLTPAEELVVARSAAGSGPVARAIAGFERGLSERALVTPRDELLYAQSLARAGRAREALARLARIEGSLAGEAAYQRARILLTSGTADATRAALRDVAAKFPDDTAIASSALYLLADLTTDQGDDDEARSIFRRLYHTYPRSGRAASARFRAALIALVQGNPAAAARELDSLAVVMPASDEALAARYWAGRAWADAGNDTLAQARWREVIAQQPVSYYATIGARRLGEKPWAPASRRDSMPRLPDVDSAFARASLLDRLGMDAEVRFEYDALEEGAGASADRLVATATAFLSHDQPSRAIRLAQKLIDRGRRDARVYRLLFPILHRDELTRDANARGLDPALVAGLIRQESNFTSHALSIAGARGLMQVLPSVGADISRSLDYPVWYSVLLFDPDANLQLGTAHLAAFMKQYDSVERVLAAYNAGASRVSRWARKAGANDPEIFTERIPFTETRDYVRSVVRNAALYRSLYEW